MLRSAALVRLALFLSVVALAACGRVSNGPNIVLIYTDDQSINSLDYMPRLKASMTDQGVNFINSFVDFSLCCPSRTSLFTGQSSHNTGVVGNGEKNFGGFPGFKPFEAEALPVRLQDAGYQTAFFGKYVNGYKRGVPPGWDRWVAYAGTAKHYGFQLDIDGRKKKFGAEPKDYGDDVIARHATNWIGKASKSQPFFVMVSTKNPHAPHVPPPRHDGAFADLALPMPPNFNEADISDKPTFNQFPLLSEKQIEEITIAFRRRQEQLKAVEDIVEQVIEALRKAGRLDNTIIIFTSDNGFSHGEHRRPTNKSMLYEEVIRVPLIMRGPGIPAGETRAQLVNNLDVTASILSWAGAKPYYVPDGRPLAPIIADPNAPWRTQLVVHGYSSDNLKPSISPKINRFGAVRTERWVFARHTLKHDESAEELYDLASDPWQLDNLSGDPAYAEVADQLRSVLDKLGKCKGDGCWVTEPEPTPPVTTALAPGG